MRVPNAKRGPKPLPPTPFGPGPRRRKEPEQELDSLITAFHERRKNHETKVSGEKDRIQVVRDRMINEYIPIFVELVEKYSPTGLTMHMDASRFLEGGREIRFEFSIGGYRTELLGTVTTEAIAFHETRSSPEISGELLSGPMLRLRGLSGDKFRRFICDRLTILLRNALGRR